MRVFFIYLFHRPALCQAMAPTRNTLLCLPASLDLSACVVEQQEHYNKTPVPDNRLYFRKEV